MQSIFAVVALILAITSPAEDKSAAGYGVNTAQHVAGFGLPRLPGLPHVPKPKWP